MNTLQKFPRKTFWCLLAIMLLASTLIWQFGVGAQSQRTTVSPRVQQAVRRAGNRTVSATTAQTAIQNARALVDQAIAAEKANPTKQAALDVEPRPGPDPSPAGTLHAAHRAQPLDIGAAMSVEDRIEKTAHLVLVALLLATLFLVVKPGLRFVV